MHHRRRSLPSVQLDPEDIRNNNSLFRFLNDKDRDILYLIFLCKKKQEAVSRIMRRTQPCIVYDVRRIRERIKFISYLRDAFDILVDFIETRSKQYDDDMIEMLVAMYYTTSYSLAGELLKISQSTVWNTYADALNKMKELKHWDAYELFSVIERNKNKVKRLYNRTPAA